MRRLTDGIGMAAVLAQQVHLAHMDGALRMVLVPLRHAPSAKISYISSPDHREPPELHGQHRVMRLPRSKCQYLPGMEFAFLNWRGLGIHKGD